MGLVLGLMAGPSSSAGRLDGGGVAGFLGGDRARSRPMVTEFAEIEVKPGMAQQFRDGVEASKPVFARAPGCHGVELHHSIEQPDKFLLLVKWDSVAHHMEMFQKSPDFQVWRGNVGHCFAGRPNVWHSETVVTG